jgi:hypothetical protein
MTRPRFIDDQGRLLGRVNIVDAGIGLVVLMAIPFAYLGFLLFRSPRPVITSVEPAQLTYIEERASAGTQLSGKLKVHGRGLQPMLRATIDQTAAIAFVFESPASADVLFGETPEGTHDLILYDGVQEVARAPKAVTIPPKVTGMQARMRVVGTLIDLDESAGKALHVGDRFPPKGKVESEIVALGDVTTDLRRVSQVAGRVDVAVEGRWQRQAALVVNCEMSAPEECRVNGITLGFANRVMPVPGAQTSLKIRIDEIVPAAEPQRADARVRFIVQPETADLIKVGDVDVSASPLDGRAAVIAAIASRQVVQGEASVASPLEGAPDAVSLRAPGRVAIVEVDLRLGVDPSQLGFRYRTTPVRAGGTLTFTSSTYVMRGIVLTFNVRTER